MSESEDVTTNFTGEEIEKGVENVKIEDAENEEITIPTLPAGKSLELRLLSNWGDVNYIGLNSVELFTAEGGRAQVEKISTNTTDYNGRLESLLAEQIRCKDTGKMWCAKRKIDSGNGQMEPVTVTIEMKEVTRFALMRFWNYNATRVHAQIGVRQLEMRLDGTPIFRGDLECSFSADSEFAPVMGETVLFTTSDEILERIALHDVCLIEFPDEKLLNPTIEMFKSDQLTPYRPSTCESKTAPPTPVDGPVTVAKLFPADDTPPPPRTAYKQDVRVLHIELVTNWGMSGLIGLTGLEIVDEHNQIIDQSEFTLTTSDGNTEHALRLFNGKNLTRNPQDMWLVEFDPKKPVTLSISFKKPITLKAISLWNYNASFELSYAGVKVMNVYANGKPFLNCGLLRKATGFVYFDYVQDLVMDLKSSDSCSAGRPMTQSVGGFVFQIRLLSTWGDEFYIGLNGIELYDRKGKLIQVQEHHLAAFPESVNILPNIKNDLRTSNNLITGPNDTDIAKHMWLTPLLPNRCARVFFVFDYPTYVSKMVIYNYRKTPERGARHISISVDDLIIFSGEIPSSTHEQTAKLEINLRDFC